MGAIFNNRVLRFEGHNYEIFWTSQDARHICQNYKENDGLHDVHHEEILWLLEHYSDYVAYKNNRYTFITRYKERAYETHVFLKQGTSTRPGRCIIKSSYRSNNIDYIRLYQ